MSRYTFRQISATRKAVYDYVEANPGCTKNAIVEATGVNKEKVRMYLIRGSVAGEIISSGENKRKYTYCIGVRMDREPKDKNHRRQFWKKKPKAEKVVKPPKQEKPEKKKQSVKQTKTWTLPERQDVTITYPPGYVHTVCVSARYEPLVVGVHV